MKLQELRSDQADFRRLGRVSPVAIVPTGAIEQHSGHLPLGTDAMIAELVAAAVEERWPERVLLLPTVSVGASDHHLAMPGTVSVGTASIADAVARQCLSLARSSDVQLFLILNGHGGNQPAVRLALELIAAAEPALRGYAVDYWALMFEELDRRGVSRPQAMGHADLIETSILLASYPHLVDMGRASADEYRDELPSSVATTQGIPARTRGGGVGDPRAATAERGGEFMDAAIAAVGRLLDQICRPADSF